MEKELIEKAKKVANNLYELLQTKKEDVLAIYEEAGIVETKPTVESFFRLKTENEEAFQKLLLLLWPEASIEAMQVANADGELWYDRLLDAAIINPLNTVTEATGQMLKLPATLVTKLGTSNIDSLATAQETLDYYTEEIARYRAIAIAVGIIDIIVIVFLLIIKK